MNNKSVKYKQKISIIISIILLVIISIITYNYCQNKDIYIGKKEEIKEENNSSIAIMLQNEEGQYVKSTNNEWPTSGYAFNENKSKCEQGSKLLWNELTHSVMLKTTKSEKCYVYFDKGYSVTVEVTGGHVDQSPKTVVSGSDAIFTLTADEGYDLAKAKVTEGQCELSNNNATLTAKNVTGNISCKVDIQKLGIFEDPYYPLPTIMGSPTNAAGEEVDVTLSPCEPKAGETINSIISDFMNFNLSEDNPDLYSAILSNQAAISDIFDIDLTNGDGTSLDSPITVTFISDLGNIAGVYYQKEDGTWDKAVFINNVDGSVTVTFEHFCTVIFISQAIQLP